MAEVFQCAEKVPSFCNGQLVEYFVSRTVSDGLPAGDFKSINTKAKGLFDCGHVQAIQVSFSSSHLWIRANCCPEMKKDVLYKVVMSLQINGYAIDTAACGCKAGKGPRASCKHVGALCYAFAEFCTFGKLPEFISSTQKLQEWNQPHPRRVDIIPVVDLTLWTRCTKYLAL